MNLRSARETVTVEQAGKESSPVFAVMTDEMYLENLDEFVNDENKVVRHFYESYSIVIAFNSVQAAVA